MKVFILRTADIPCGQGMLIIAAENKHQAYQIALQNKVNITIDSDWESEIEEAEHLQTDLTTPQLIDYSCYIE